MTEDQRATCEKMISQCKRLAKYSLAFMVIPGAVVVYAVVTIENRPFWPWTLVFGGVISVMAYVRFASFEIRADALRDIATLFDSEKKAKSETDV